MSKAVSILFSAVLLWGALAQAMPGMFQVRSEGAVMKFLWKFLWGTRTMLAAVVMAALLLSWFMWNTENRLNHLAASLHTETPSRPVTEETLKLSGWGTDPTFSTCNGTIDASRLLPEEKGKFEIGLVCGFSDPSGDPLKDTRISVSRLFTPQDSLIIAVPFSQAMSDGLNDYEKEAIKRFFPNAKKGTEANVVMDLWVRTVLLPKGFDVSQIHKLEDVTLNGGRISTSGGVERVLKRSTVR